jgi:hypothetical protein
MNLLPWLLELAVTAFGFYEQREAKSASQHAEAAQIRLEESKVELDTLHHDAALNDKRRAQDLETIKALENTKQELTASQTQLQAQLNESAKKLATAQSSSDDTKKQTTELDEVKKQLAERDTQLATAQSEAANSRAEIQRLREAQSRPPLGTAMDRKR